MVCRVLVADDSTPIQKVIKIAFSKYAVEIITASSLLEALKESDRVNPDIIIADAGLPGVSAASDFLKLTAKFQNIPIVILMGSYESVRESDLRASSLSHIIKKPFDAMELLTLVEGLVPDKFTAAGATPPVPKVPAPPISARQKAENTSAKVDSTPDLDLGFAPPMPMTEPTRKGRPAFDASSMPGMQSIPEPVFDLGSSIEPLQEERPLAFSSSNPTRSGVRSAAEDAIPAFSSRPPVAPPARSTPTAANAPVTAAQIEEIVRRELPAIVEEAVEHYCREHFKSIAREVLTTELRRLAEEKARYLVDQ